jgi:S-formylglutathione hydrolase
MERIEHHASFGGRQEVWRTPAPPWAATMKLGVYLPPAALRGEPCPVLYWLSGLTCTSRTSSPRPAHRPMRRNTADRGGTGHQSARQTLDVPNDPAYDLGRARASTSTPRRRPGPRTSAWKDYVVDELPALVEAQFPRTTARAISGHSMGGHGALVCALRNPGRYRSVSASPIVAPSRVPWGQKAFAAYLGEDQHAWKAYANGVARAGRC